MPELEALVQHTLLELAKHSHKALSHSHPALANRVLKAHPQGQLCNPWFWCFVFPFSPLNDGERAFIRQLLARRLEIVQIQQAGSPCSCPTYQEGMQTLQTFS